MRAHELAAGAWALSVWSMLFFACAVVTASHSMAAQPKVADTIAERVAPCTTCHGREGRATSEGYFPRIAGKPAGYLFNQLVHFREGRRHYALMTYLVDHLTDSYLREMAEYFAALQLPYPPPQAVRAPPAVFSRGEALVRKGEPAKEIPACVECHGQALMGVEPAFPGLLGLSRDYLHGQLGHWKTGQRRAHAPDCMSKIAGILTYEDIDAVSAWLASQPVPVGGRPAPKAARPLPIDCGGVSSVAK
jgi:cytochrome c553